MHVSANKQVYPLLNTVLNTYSCKETKNAIIKKDYSRNCYYFAFIEGVWCDFCRTVTQCDRP